MGYPSAARLVETIAYLEMSNASGPPAVLEFGDQTLTVREADLEPIRQFLEHFGASDKASAYESRVGECIFVGEIYRDAGIDYTCLDLNENNGALPIDLNRWPNPVLDKRYLQRFDLVANYGTTEHVANQMNAFAIAHYLCKPGGLMLHHIPMLHYSNHAIAVVTPLFAKKLIDMNRYEIVQAEWRSHVLNSAISFHYAASLAFMKNFVDVIESSTVAAIGFLLLRNAHGTSYVPPLDIAVEGDAEKRLLTGYIEDYAHPDLPVDAGALAGAVAVADSVTDQWIKTHQIDGKYQGRSSFLLNELSDAVKVERNQSDPRRFNITPR